MKLKHKEVCENSMLCSLQVKRIQWRFYVSVDWLQISKSYALQCAISDLSSYLSSISGFHSSFRLEWIFQAITRCVESQQTSELLSFSQSLFWLLMAKMSLFLTIYKRSVYFYYISVTVAVCSFLTLLQLKNKHKPVCAYSQYEKS